MPADLCKFALGQVVGLFEAGASSAPSGSIITSTGSNDQVHKEMVEMVAAGASSLTNLSTERDARPGNTAVAEKSGLDKSVAKGCLLAGVTCLYRIWWGCLSWLWERLNKKVLALAM